MAVEDVEGFVRLRNGVQMPIFGLGTTHNGGYNHKAVVHALSHCGYRLIDTAKRYGTEAYVGQAVIDSGIDRDDVFLTTKLWPTDYGLAGALTAFAGSAARLQTDYVDLYLMHWPEVRGCDGDRRALLNETWRALELLLDSGRCRAIGVSNFGQSDLDDLVEDNGECSGMQPHVNQCEFHPYWNPRELRAFCHDRRIQFQGYCPLAKGRILNAALLTAIAARTGLTPAQVALRWSLQHGAVTIPKSNNASRIAENIESLRLTLPECEMRLLDALPNDAGKTVVDLKGMKRTIDSDLPDGYKLNRFSNVFPTFMRPARK